MIYLILCIFFNVGIFICFKFFSKYNIPLLTAIVINYCVCVITGSIYSGGSLITVLNEGVATWMYFAFGLGFIFLATFYLMAYITHKFSISVSSISSKISLVIPVLFSLFVLQTQVLDYNWINYLGMFGALGAIIFSSLKERKMETTDLSRTHLWLPFALFFLNGLIDTSINLVSNRYLDESAEAVFPIGIFFTAAVTGLIISVVKKIRFSKKVLVGGLILGVINYFSVLTMVKALTAHNDDGAFVYPVLNLGIIILASLISLVFFKERFSKLNWFGFLLAILSLVFLSHQAIF